MDTALTPYNWTTGILIDHPRKKLKIKNHELYWNSSFFLEKQMIYGSSFRISYLNNYGWTGFQNIPSFNQPFSNPSYSQGVSFQIEQNLLRNFFGRSDRLKFQSAKFHYQSIQLSRKKELGQLIISAGEKFWNSYIAYKQLKQAQKQTKDYKELVRIAKKKHKLGHSHPGEIPQILSQLERAFKRQKQAETQLKNANSQLKTFLQTQKSNFKFTNHKPQPLPKKIPVKDPSALMTAQIMYKNFLSEKAQLDSQKHFYLPYLKLKAQADFLGSHPDNLKKSFENLKLKESQNYSIGVELIYPIPSSFSMWKKSTQLKSQTLQKQLEYQKEIENFKNQLESSWNSLENTHLSMHSSFKISKLQNKALEEIRKSYIQGRTSMADLISAQDLSVQMELEKIQAQKNYNSSLFQFYFLRDQLLSKYMP